MPTSVSLIVGLGNPGSQYVSTRHNVGHRFVDQLVDKFNVRLRSESRFNAEIERARIGGDAVWLLKPETFMNDSGQSVADFASYYKIPTASILVAHDELSIKCGTVQIKSGGGHAGHNGVRNIAKHLGGDFQRLRIGIDRPPQGHDVARFVLGTPRAEEQDAINAAILRAVDSIDAIVAGAAKL